MKNISSWNFVLVTFKNRFRSFISTFLPEFSLSSYSFSRRVEARPIEREDISLKRWNFFERWGTTGGEIWIDIRSTSEISMVEKCQIIGSKTGNWISNDCSIRTFNLYFTRESARSETKAGSHTGFRPISRSTLTCITPPIHDRDPISPSILSDNREEEWNSRHAPSFPKIKFPFPFYLLEINATAEVANFNFQTSFSACLVIEKSTTRWYSIVVKNRRCCTRFNLIPSSSLSNDKNQRIGPIIRSFDACPRERVYLRSRKVFTLAKKKERGGKKKKEKSLAFPDEKHPVEDINEWRCIIFIIRILSWFMYDGKIWRFERRRLSDAAMFHASLFTLDFVTFDSRDRGITSLSGNNRKLVLWDAFDLKFQTKLFLLAMCPMC